MTDMLEVIHEGQIDLSALVLDPTTQIRGETSAATIADYREAMRADATFPPITVAYAHPDEPDRGFILIDGWHRVRAAQALGRGFISAKVIAETDPKRWRWIAAQGNRAHGLQLSKDDKRGVFRAYVQAGEHRTGRGTSIKSAREMARDLQGIVSDRQLPQWMKQDFPKVYRAMRGSGLEEQPHGEFGRIPMDERLRRKAETALEEFLAAHNAIKGKEQREALVQMISDAAHRAAAGRTLPTIVPDEF